MAETASSEPAHAVTEVDEPTSKHSWKSQWPALAAAAIAVVAVVLAALAYFHPAHHSGAGGTVQQGGDAKANVCSAFDVVRKGVVINTHLQASNNPVAELSVAANARLALVGGGSFLHDRLAANTAAPHDLANGVDSLAGTIAQLGVNYLAGASPADQESLRNNLNTQLNQVAKLCE